MGKTIKRDWYVQIDVHGGKDNAVGKVPVNATSYAHRDFLFMFNWYDRVDTGMYPSDGFSFLQTFVKNVTVGLEKSQWGQYINYPDQKLDQAAAQSNYWGKNIDKLQQMKKVLDPDDLFHYPQGVMPAK